MSEWCARFAVAFRLLNVWDTELCIGFIIQGQLSPNPKPPNPKPLNT